MELALIIYSTSSGNRIFTFNVPLRIFVLKYKMLTRSNALKPTNKQKDII